MRSLPGAARDFFQSGDGKRRSTFCHRRLSTYYLVDSLGPEQREQFTQHVYTLAFVQSTSLCCLYQPTLTRANRLGIAMAKGSANQTRSVPNKHLHARIAYLHQAATHLALQAPAVTHTDPSKLQQRGLPLLLTAQLQAVSQKAQIRLSHDMKRSICKACSTPLMPDTTSETRIENKSRAEKKPCADVLVIQCRNCHAEKRFPIGAQRQKRKAERRLASVAVDPKGAKKQSSEVEMVDV